MGQYYKPCILNDCEKVVAWAYSHDYDNGLKLMEHSWLHNNFVARIVAEIVETPQMIVWAGDYADPEPDTEDNLYSMCYDSTKMPKELHEIDYGAYRFLVNDDAEEYVDLSSLPDDDG